MQRKVGIGLCKDGPFANLRSHVGFPVALVVKILLTNPGDIRCELDPWVGKIPWSRKWQPTPVASPEKYHEQRSLAGYNPGVTKSRHN